MSQKSLNNNLEVFRNKGKKDFQHWVTANDAATDKRSPKNKALPKRNLLIDLFEKTLDEPYVFNPVNHRKEAFLGEKFILVNESGTIDEEAIKLLDHHWFYKFLTQAILTRFFGYTLSEIHLGEDGFVEDVKSIQRRNIVPEAKVVLTQLGDDKTAIDFTKGNISQYLVWMEDDTNDGMGILNKCVVPTLMVMYCSMYWLEQADKAGLPLTVLKVAGGSAGKFHQLQGLLSEMGRDGLLMADIGDEIELLNRNQTGHQIYMELIQEKKNEIAQAILGQTGTTQGSANYRDAFNQMAVQQIIQESDGRWKERVVNDLLLPKLSQFPQYRKLQGLRFKRYKEDVLDFDQKIKVYQQARLDPFLKANVEAMNRMFPGFDFEEVMPLNLPNQPKAKPEEDDNED